MNPRVGTTATQRKTNREHRKATPELTAGKKSISHAGTRTRVYRVKADYPNHLDYMGLPCSSTPGLTRIKRRDGRPPRPAFRLVCQKDSGHTGARTLDRGVISTALYRLSYTTILGEPGASAIISLRRYSPLVSWGRAGPGRCKNTTAIRIQRMIT